jgi:ferredoxin-NADP reductase
VTGVVTDRGEEVSADLVVANANPITTCTELIDPTELPEAFLRRLDFGEPGISAASLYLGLSRPSRELGIEDHEVYVNATLDMEEQHARCFEIGPQGLIGICAYDVENPDFCPPGTGAVTLTSLSDGRAWEKIDDEQYPVLKQRLAESMLEQAAELYPDLPGSIETAVVATPVTNMRYTGNPGGAIYGFANTPPHGPGFRLDNRGPLEGLWFASAWAQPSGGYQGAISSGMRVADGILDERGGERTIPSEVDLARTIGPVPSAGAWRRIKGFGPLFRDIKQVGATVRTKYKIPGEPKDDFVPQDTTGETVRRYHAERRSVEVREKIERTADTVTLRLAPREGRLPPFFAGQYFNLYVENEGIVTSRPYSISSRPDPSGLLEITVKKKDQGFVSGQLVEEVRVGDQVELTGPAGEFYLNPFRDTDDIVGLAVGSGITPFLSIIEDLAEHGSSLRLLLLYGSRTEGDIIFRERLEALDRDNDWLRVVLTLSKPGLGWKGERGRIDKAFLERHLDGADLGGKTFFVCGPRELYRSILIGLGELGVPRSRVRLESYGPPDDVTREQEWPTHVDQQTRFRVWVGDRDEPILAPAGEPLLNSLERAGLEYPSLCRSDVCDSCRLRMTEGQVFVPSDELGMRTGHEGFIHPCMAYPVSDLKLVQ